MYNSRFKSFILYFFSRLVRFLSLFIACFLVSKSGPNLLSSYLYSGCSDTIVFIAGKLFETRHHSLSVIVLTIFRVRSASLPISNDNKWSNEFFISSGSAVSKVHGAIGAISHQFKSLFVIVISFNISITFLQLGFDSCCVK
jgi:hypothetical protein